MKLPRAEQVRIDERKILGYLLSPHHPVGRFKARVFAALGFNEASLAAFVTEIRRIALEGEVQQAEDTGFGRKYTVPGDLRGPLGAAPVLTVWFQDPAQPDVRLVTVRPR